jgi:malate dehydrogenase (oxaloacetate-decarboxylating)
MATGRSDFTNQINNSIFFPGFWRGMLDRQNKKLKDASKYDEKLLVKCAIVIAKMVKPSEKNILPSTLDKKVHLQIARTVLNYK